MSPPDTRWGAVLTLCRISNAPTVWSNVLAGWFLAGGALDWRLFTMLLGATALYCGGTTLNDAFDAVFDRRYRPERPIPSGVFTRGQVFALGFGWMTLGSLLMLVGGANDLCLLLLIAAIIGYDIRHKNGPASSWVMGAARGLLVLTAGSATGLGSLPLWLWALAHLAYIAGLTWTAAGESGPRREPANTRAQTLLLLSPVAATLLLLIVGFPGVPGLFGALAIAVFFVVWIAPALPAQSQPLPPFQGIPRLLLGIILVDAIALATVHLLLGGLALFGLLWLGKCLQETFAAT